MTIRNCVECGGELVLQQVKKGRRIDRYLQCEYCDFKISATEGDIAALNDETTPPPRKYPDNNDY